MQEKCLQYLRDRQLFSPANPTEITVDDNIREALQVSTDSKITLFDFIDRIGKVLAVLQK